MQNYQKNSCLDIWHIGLCLFLILYFSEIFFNWNWYQKCSQKFIHFWLSLKNICRKLFWIQKYKYSCDKTIFTIELYLPSENLPLTSVFNFAVLQQNTSAFQKSSLSSRWRCYFKSRILLSAQNNLVQFLILLLLLLMTQLPVKCIKVRF